MQHAGRYESYEEQVAASYDALGLAPMHRHRCRALQLWVGCALLELLQVRRSSNDCLQLLLL